MVGPVKCTSGIHNLEVSAGCVSLSLVGLCSACQFSRHFVVSLWVLLKVEAVRVRGVVFSSTHSLAYLQGLCRSGSSHVYTKRLAGPADLNCLLLLWCFSFPPVTVGKSGCCCATQLSPAASQCPRVPSHFCPHLWWPVHTCHSWLYFACFPLPTFYGLSSWISTSVDFLSRQSPL